MLLHWRCCFVEDVVALKMLKMLLRWRCWRCCYVEGVVTLRMLLRCRCLLRWTCCYVEKRGCAFRPGELWHFSGIHENTEISISTQFYWFLRKQCKMNNLKNFKLVKTADNIPRYVVHVLEPFNVLSCSMKTTKHCKTQWKWHFQIFLQLHFTCAPGNLKPLPYLYIYIYPQTLCLAAGLVRVSPSDAFKAARLQSLQWDDENVSWMCSCGTSFWKN